MPAEGGHGLPPVTLSSPSSAPRGRTPTKPLRKERWGRGQGGFSVRFASKEPAFLCLIPQALLPVRGTLRDRGEPGSLAQMGASGPQRSPARHGADQSPGSTWSPWTGWGGEEDLVFSPKGGGGQSPTPCEQARRASAGLACG